jgi:hypothetical protein
METSFKILFIGSPIGKELVSKEREIKLIRAMLEFYKNYEIIYAVHRFEDIEYLRSNILDSKITFKKFETALEVAIFNERFIPIKISSFCSSALFNLKILCDSSADVLEIPTMWLSNEHSKNLELIYETYRNSGIVFKRYVDGVFID